MPVTATVLLPALGLDNVPVPDTDSRSFVKPTGAKLKEATVVPLYTDGFVVAVGLINNWLTTLLAVEVTAAKV